MGHQTATDHRYLHGYSTRESDRLREQADTLAGLLHGDTRYPTGSTVLEVGCGVGAQTAHLTRTSPGARIVSIDISARSLGVAARRVRGHTPSARVSWCRADLLHPPFADGVFDHVFVCFVLEHLSDPGVALDGLRRLLRPGGTLTVIEGDHGSVLFHPDSAHARAVISCQVQLQAALGGDAELGRRLQPLLTDAGYREVTVRPRTVYADHTRPELVDGFTLGTFIPVIESQRRAALAAGLATPADWDRGIADLHRTARPGGTFHYTFFLATAVRPGTAENPHGGARRRP